MSEFYDESTPETRPDCFHVHSAILTAPFLNNGKRDATALGVLLWLAGCGEKITLHFDDIVDAVGTHPRRVGSILRKLEAGGQIEVSGSGAIRTITITSEWVRTSGEWISMRASWGSNRGAGKWRFSPLNPSLRKKVFERDGNACAYCGTTEGPFHIDHKTPVARGGKDCLSNLTVACQQCNLSKGSKSLKEWLQ